jgi:hypothetical protein
MRDGHCNRKGMEAEELEEYKDKLKNIVEQRCVSEGVFCATVDNSRGSHGSVGEG